MTSVKPISASDVPAGISIDRFGPELTITRSWYEQFAWLSLLWSIGWNVGAWNIYFIALTQRPLDFPGPFFFVPHLAIGLAVPYVAACLFFNRTSIQVRDGRLRVRHGPLPWLRDREFATQNFVQLYCVERQGSKGGRRYDVMIWNRDDSHNVLLARIADENQALFIERQIERHLGLTKMKERVPPGFMRRGLRRRSPLFTAA